MPKFLCGHTVPPGAIQRPDVEKLAASAAAEPDVHPYHSFVNMSAGKAACVLEAPNREALEAWFAKVELPYDFIVPVELEITEGRVHDA